MMFHKEHLTTPLPKILHTPTPYCVHGRVAYSISQPPIRIGMLGYSPSACVAGLGNLWQILAKENVSHPLVTLSHPVITLFTLLTIFLFTIKAKTTWP